MQEHKFAFDSCVGEFHRALDLLEESVRDLVDNSLAGGTSTCFCLGQTASGKTLTLFGAGGRQVVSDFYDERGGNNLLSGIYVTCYV